MINSPSVSRANPPASRIAFQGEAGAYSEAAIIEYSRIRAQPQPVTVPSTTFEEVFAAVEQGDCQFGIIPIENSLAGSIHRNYDLLLQHDLWVVGEQYLRVSHCLLASP